MSLQPVVLGILRLREDKNVDTSPPVGQGSELGLAKLWETQGLVPGLLGKPKGREPSSEEGFCPQEGFEGKENRKGRNSSARPMETAGLQLQG